MALAMCLHKTVEELDATMSSAELAEWLALLAVEPWGPYRADLHAALQAWSQVSVWNKEAKFSDYLLKFGDDPKLETEPDEETEQQRFRMMQARLLAMGGTVPNG